MNKIRLDFERKLLECPSKLRYESEDFGRLKLRAILRESFLSELLLKYVKYTSVVFVPTILPFEPFSFDFWVNSPRGGEGT